MAQIDRVLEMNLMADLINVLSHGDFKAKKEATWAVTNLTSGGKPQQMQKIIELGVLEPLARMLTCNDIKIVQVLVLDLVNFNVIWVLTLMQSKFVLYWHRFIKVFFDWYKNAT